MLTITSEVYHFNRVLQTESTFSKRSDQVIYDSCCKEGLCYLTIRMESIFSVNLMS